MSIYNAQLTKDPAVILEGHEGFGIVSITAKQLIDTGLEIVLKPKPGFPGHAEAIGKKTGSIRNNLAKNCAYVVLPSPLTTSD